MSRRRVIAAASSAGTPPSQPYRRAWRFVAAMVAAAFLLLVIVTIISGPMPMTPVKTSASGQRPHEPSALVHDQQDREFGGSWTLAVRDIDGGAVYIDRDDIRTAGDRKVADLGIVSRSGRKVERISVRCSDNWLTPGQNFGDDVETSDELDSAPPGSHSVVDYVCGRAPLPATVVKVLPDHS